MKKQINEIRRMQQLAGILKEGQLNENMYYVHDKEGMEEPIGPFNLEQANNEKRRLGADYDIMDEKTAKEIWSHLAESQLNETTDRQIIQFVKLVDPEGNDYIRVYFSNAGSRNIDGAIDYLASHSSLYDNNPNSEDQDGGLSGFTKSDLIQYAQEAGWNEADIDYMLELSPVKFLERG